MSKEVASLHAKIGVDLSALQRGLAQAKEDLNKTVDHLGKVGNQMKSLGTQMSLGLSLPLAGLGVAMLKTTADFEQNGNVLKSVIQGTATDMEMLRNQALKLGKDTVFSAGQASEAMLELGKSGLNATQIYQAMPGVLTLAAAANTSMANAAEIAANAVNTFGLSAKDIPIVADTLAAAANASSVEIDDLRLSFSMAGAVMASSKMTFQETATVLGILGNNGIKGSDAGTSLKQMFLALQTPSKEQTKIMEQLGFSIYDVNGNMLDMRGVIGNLELATQGLTQKQRDYVLGTIFGSDAVRSANILLKEGVEGYDKMNAAVTRSGAAQDVANARMKGLAGAFEYFKGTVNTVLISTGAPWSEMLSGMIKGAADLIGGFSSLSPEIQKTAVVIGAVLAVAGPVLIVLGSLASSVAALAPVFAVLTGPIGLVALAVGALGLAFATDFGGIRTTVMPVIDAVLGGLSTLASGFWSALQDISRTANSIGQAIYDGLQWINPLVRHSPSLVESWDAGAKSINKDIGSVASSANTLKTAGQVVNGFGKDISKIGPASSSAKGNVDGLKHSVSGLKDTVGALRTALSTAQSQLDFFGSVPFAGSGAFDDEIFAMEQEAKRVEYEMLKFQHSGLGQDAMQPRYEEMKQYNDALRERIRMKRLEKEIAFEPLERARQQALKPRTELPFADVMKGIEDYKKQVSELKIELDKSEKSLAANEKQLSAISGLGGGPAATFDKTAQSAKELDKALDSTNKNMGKYITDYGKVGPEAAPRMLGPELPPGWGEAMSEVETWNPPLSNWERFVGIIKDFDMSKVELAFAVANVPIAIFQRNMSDLSDRWTYLRRDLGELFDSFTKEVTPALDAADAALVGAEGDSGLKGALESVGNYIGGTLIDIYTRLRDIVKSATEWFWNLANAIKGTPQTGGTSSGQNNDTSGDTGDSAGSSMGANYAGLMGSNVQNNSSTSTSITVVVPPGSPQQTQQAAERGALNALSLARSRGY